MFELGYPCNRKRNPPARTSSIPTDALAVLLRITEIAQGLMSVSSRETAQATNLSQLLPPPCHHLHHHHCHHHGHRLSCTSYHTKSIIQLLFQHHIASPSSEAIQPSHRSRTTKRRAPLPTASARWRTPASRPSSPCERYLTAKKRTGCSCPWRS